MTAPSYIFTSNVFNVDTLPV